jgi:dTDP-4-dehydrorhamnose reductase
MIWLVGNRGMIGTELSELLSREDTEFMGTDREVSILDPAALDGFVNGRKISWNVNCAALRRPRAEFRDHDAPPHG